MVSDTTTEKNGFPQDIIGSQIVHEKCEVQPSKGVFMETVFNMSCQNFPQSEYQMFSLYSVVRGKGKVLVLIKNIDKIFSVIIRLSKDD